MRDITRPSLAAEAPVNVISALSRVLAEDVRKARNRADLSRRLARKGYQIQSGYLVTAPHGKLICPLSAL